MPIFKWQTNDALSTYNSSTGSVLSGTANLSTPPSNLFTFFEDFGKSLRRPGDVLSPREALEIKLGFGSKYTTANQGIWKIVDERLATEPNLRTRYQSLLTSLTPAARELDTRRRAQLAAELQVASIESYITQELSKFCREKTSSRGAPSAIRDRFRHSTFDGLQFEESMQILSNASTTASPNPNVFSLMGDGKTPDPVVDTLASIYCRVLQDPSKPAPNFANVGGTREQQWVLDMEKGGLGHFYPAMNLSAIPAGYPQIKPRADRIRGLVVQARTRAARLAASVPNVFGSTQVLVKMFEQGSPAFKMGMLRVFYPWKHRSDVQNGLSSFGTKEGQSLNFMVGDVRMQCTYRDLLHTMYLLDYLSVSNHELRKHTVNYLAWVKRKCTALAIASKSTAAKAPTGQLISVPLQSQVQKSTSPFGASTSSSLTANRLPTTKTSITQSLPLPPTLPAIPVLTSEPEVTELADSEEVGAFEFEEGTVGTFGPDDLPDVGSGDGVILQEQESKLSTAKAAGSVSSKHIYIGSAAAIALAIGTYIVVKKSRQQI